MDARAVLWALLVCGALAACGRGPGELSQATPSPDIAYSFGGRIFAMQADGSGATRLTGGRAIGDGSGDMDPAWAPDGSRLAFVRVPLERDEAGHRSRLYLLDPLGGAPRALTADDGALVLDPAWSPDGRRIAFARLAGEGERESQIVVADVDGGAERVVWREPPGQRVLGVREPVWSPDGARIAYTRTLLDRSYHLRSSLLTIAADGGGPRSLVKDAADAAWSPDGAQIAFSGTRDRNGESCGSDECSYNGELYVMDADGGNQVRLTHNRGIDRSPSWSPDGRRIAFSSDRNNRSEPFGFDTEIYSIGADGSCLTWLTNGAPASLDPAWRQAPGGSSDPGGCGATRRPPRTEVDLRAVRHRDPVLWLGERYGDLLLDRVDVTRNQRSGRSYYFAYDDCALFHPRDCPSELTVEATSVCSRLSPLGGFNERLSPRLRRSFADRGLLLVRLHLGGASVIAGRASVKVFVHSGPGRRRRQALAAARALRPIGNRAKAPATPALPRAVLRSLHETEREMQRLGSADAVARALGTSPQRVQRRLALARAVSSLARVRAVRC
jgi:TolB protein